MSFPMTCVADESQDLFSNLLHDETWCGRYLFQLRWPHGFSCPACGRQDPGMAPSKRLTCQYCGRVTSVGSGTLLHATKKPLSLWLQVIWRLCGQPGPIRTGIIQHWLQTGSYQTAWTWVQKLRCAMRIINRTRCAGIVEVDSPPVSLAEPLARYHCLLAALEKSAGGRQAGRLQMHRFDTISVETVKCFFEDTIEPGSTIIAPDREPFRACASLDYVLTLEPPNRYSAHLDHLFSEFFNRYPVPRALPGSAARIERQLDEFCFYQNCSLLPNRRMRFELVLRAMLRHEPLAIEATARGRDGCGGGL